MKTPLLTVLNFSGGQQSSAILWMVIRGELVPESDFLVLNADPGMENSRTYEYVNMMKEECSQAGIKFKTVEGRNLYKDILNLKNTQKTRLDNPPYWTKRLKKDGTFNKGKLLQKCTYKYKIQPMDRYLRKYLEDKYGISEKTKKLGDGIVEKWIGFSLDEKHRVKYSSTKYIDFAFPLIDPLKMTKKDTEEYFHKNNLPKPPRSVCNACFANGVDYFRDMFNSRPEDWNQAVAVDKAVRDWSQIGVRDAVYVSSTLMSLEEMAERNFNLEEIDPEQDGCDSGYCFV